jgi:hypothetical protein
LLLINFACSQNRLEVKISEAFISELTITIESYDFQVSEKCFVFYFPKRACDFCKIKCLEAISGSEFNIYLEKAVLVFQDPNSRHLKELQKFRGLYLPTMEQDMSGFEWIEGDQVGLYIVDLQSKTLFDSFIFTSEPDTSLFSDFLKSL